MDYNKSSAKLRLVLLILLALIIPAVNCFALLPLREYFNGDMYNILPYTVFDGASYFFSAFAKYACIGVIVASVLARHGKRAAAYSLVFTAVYLLSSTFLPFLSGIFFPKLIPIQNGDLFYAIMSMLSDIVFIIAIYVLCVIFRKYAQRKGIDVFDHDSADTKKYVCTRALIIIAIICTVTLITSGINIVSNMLSYGISAENVTQLIKEAGYAVISFIIGAITAPLVIKNIFIIDKK
ncbi:MAG: hypothetical protein J5922_04475 [Clostridia bacterium]|nr:hypothetical protein [Clostridia bacterium]